MMEKKRILCFGDSLTWGWNPDERGRFSEKDRWPMVMQEQLGNAYCVVEEGQPGRTIATDDPAEGEKNGLSYIIPCLESHAPLDLVIIMLGTNDCKKKFSYSSMDIAGEMQIFLEKVLAYDHFRCNDSFQILLICPPAISEDVKDSWLGECFDYPQAEEIFQRLPDWYRQLSEMYHCSWINASDHVKTCSYDGCHMDAENQRKLGIAVADYIKEKFC